MTRGQVNEMCWAIQHFVHEKTLPGQITRSFWLKYMKATRMVDKRSEVIPLSTFSPGALQSVWEKTIARKCIKLSKEVHWLNKKRKKLEVTEANKEKLKIN